MCTRIRVPSRGLVQSKVLATQNKICPTKFNRPALLEIRTGLGILQRMHDAVLQLLNINLKRKTSPSEHLGVPIMCWYTWTFQSCGCHVKYSLQLSGRPLKFPSGTIMVHLCIEALISAIKLPQNDTHIRLDSVGKCKPAYPPIIMRSLASDANCGSMRIASAISVNAPAG